jgi:hypothetical protein
MRALVAIAAVAWVGCARVGFDAPQSSDLATTDLTGVDLALVAASSKPS